jgi:predicted nucleotidyltransferase component of viral defense system
MISPDELREQAAVYDLNEADIQRDYVFGWLIAGIYRASNLGDIAILKGGNALRKAYFPGTRFSDDLDFSTAQGLDSEMLLRELNGVCDFAQEATGVQFDSERNRLVDEHQIDAERTVYKFRLYFKNLIGGRDHVTISVRLDVTEYDRLYLPVQERQLIHPYSDADACRATIKCVKLEEALADKLKCLLQRRYCYDLFDLVYGAFVSRDIEVDRSEIMRVFMQKTIFQDSPSAAKNLLLDLPLDLFRGYWSKVICPAVSRMSFDDAVGKLRDGVDTLFAPFGEGAHLAYAFYPSTLRNPILQAGGERRRLRLSYDGVMRDVEPYSLVFKRRKSDGVAQEYFYVWDRTGGRTSGPGIKALFHYKVDSLELSDETFEPRYPVELGKAGDSDQSGYFSQRSGGRRPAMGGTRRRSRSSVGPTYVVECSYCGKRFRRKKRSTVLRDHKDTYGNRCYGRRGTIVDYG